MTTKQESLGVSGWFWIVVGVLMVVVMVVGAGSLALNFVRENGVGGVLRGLVGVVFCIAAFLAMGQVTSTNDRWESRFYSLVMGILFAVAMACWWPWIGKGD